MAIPLLIPLLAGTGLAGLFVGSQIDDAVEEKVRPVGDNSNQPPPWYITIPMMIALSVAAVLVIKKVIK